MICHRPAACWLFVLLAALAAPVAADSYIVTGTLEAAAGQPRIFAQLRYDGEVLEGESQLKGLDLGLENMLGGSGNEASFGAFLDTGAGAYVISKSTAQRFGVRIEQDAVYHEVGLHGETPMSVTQPHALALADSTGMIDDRPGSAFRIVQTDARLMINRKSPFAGQATADVAEMLGALMEINVIGMPAIGQFVVEIDPGPMEQGMTALEPNADAMALLDNLDNLGVGPAVRLHDPGKPRPNVDLTVELEYVDFNRYHNLSDRGPKPTLARNPMLHARAEHNGAQYRARWLLDTGAAVSIISTRQAQALGLMDADGDSIVPPKFTLPITGISGGMTRASGYIINRLVVPAQNGVSIVYRNAHVIVHDVSIVLDDGSAVTLDGVFGLNLMMPTVAGMSTGLPTNVAPAPFKKIWIDGPNGTLEFETD